MFCTVTLKLVASLLVYISTLYSLDLSLRLLEPLFTYETIKEKISLGYKKLVLMYTLLFDILS